MKLLILSALAFVMPAIEASIAQAQVSIRELQNSSETSISGEIRSIVGNEFILDDGTGQIIVDAGPRWYHQLNLTSGERITVVGEYDDDDFDAYTITRDSGEVIQIRPADGPPPWAGGRK
ncbi:MAG: DNA-binding protein [Pegethrix bostrychoides GSE-TBD4-15B]|uniref:DNA-binding protein n=1 Tax=Pegethrix bostrychoides GSE-TBD4-15B TaxID=2839662 RepID=A0A951PC62_9CYAN|nr:DNA-binding protein [Pegethrix bostrychoides GSE-TBD4-15B]